MGRNREALINSKLSNKKRGAGNKPGRMIIRALIIKHKMNLSDEETIYGIQENLYMQYFIGLSEFTDKPIFDPSLFLTIRKCLGTNNFNQMSVALLFSQLEKAKSVAESKDSDKNNNLPTPIQQEDDKFTDTEGREHKGALKIDATCADAEVRYPTDIDLLHDGSKVLNRLMQKLCKSFSLEHPNSHCNKARKSYLEVIKQKKAKSSLTKRNWSYYLT